MKKRKLNVLVACESSGTVRDAFRKLGHNAWSCDLLPCDADPRYHFKCHVETVLDGMHTLMSQEGNLRKAAPWDLMIAHPPCTYLCNSGVRWLYHEPNVGNAAVIIDKLSPRRRDGKVLYTMGTQRLANAERFLKMQDASVFFTRLWTAQIRHIAVENPIPHRYGKLPNYTQIIQPWQFGHGETKATCLWLKNLPKLVPHTLAHVTKTQMLLLPKAQRQRIHMMSPGPLRWKARSKTFEGIAKAMAEQWSKYIIESK